jgi:hypothetical protein
VRHGSLALLLCLTCAPSLAQEDLFSLRSSLALPVANRLFAPGRHLPQTNIAHPIPLSYGHYVHEIPLSQTSGHYVHEIPTTFHSQPDTTKVNDEKARLLSSRQLLRPSN